MFTRRPTIGALAVGVTVIVAWTAPIGSAVGITPGSLAAPSAFPPQDGFRYQNRNEWGVPSRWNPCVTHTWSANKLLPLDKRLFTQVFRQVKKYSGLRFAYTRGKGELNVHARYRRVTPGGIGGMETGSVAEDYSPSPSTMPPNPIAHTGEVDVWMPRESPHNLRMFLFLHEVGHAVGLGHVPSRREVMLDSSGKNGTIRSPMRYFTRYQPGDIRGLRAVGMQSGCLNPPQAAQDIGVSWIVDEWWSGWHRPRIRVSWRQQTDNWPVWATEVRYTPVNGGRGDSATASGPETTVVIDSPARSCEPGESGKVEITTISANGKATTTVPAPPCPPAPTTNAMSVVE